MKILEPKFEDIRYEKNKVILTISLKTFTKELDKYVDIFKKSKLYLLVIEKNDTKKYVIIEK